MLVKRMIKPFLKIMLLVAIGTFVSRCLVGFFEYGPDATTFPVIDMLDGLTMLDRLGGRDAFEDIARKRTKTIEPYKTTDIGYGIEEFSSSANGGKIVCLRHDSKVALYDANRQKVYLGYKGRYNNVKHVVISFDGRRVAVASTMQHKKRHSIRIFDTSSGRVVTEYRWTGGTMYDLDHGPCSYLAFSNDGHSVVIFTSLCHINIFNKNSKGSQGVLIGHDNVLDIKFTPDDRLIFIAGYRTDNKKRESGFLQVVDTKTQKVVKEFQFEQLAKVNKIAFSPDNKNYAIIGSSRNNHDNYDLFVFNLESHKKINSLTGINYGQDNLHDLSWRDSDRIFLAMQEAVFEWSPLNGKRRTIFRTARQAWAGGLYFAANNTAFSIKTPKEKVFSEEDRYKRNLLSLWTLNASR